MLGRCSPPIPSSPQTGACGHFDEVIAQSDLLVIGAPHITRTPSWIETVGKPVVDVWNLLQTPGGRSSEIMSERVRIGVIGLRSAPRSTFPRFGSDPRCEVVALAGRNREERCAVARQLGVPGPSPTGVNSSLQGISTPSAWPSHQRFIPTSSAEAVGHGKHVFCEKPLAASVVEAAGAQRSTHAGVVHGDRFHFSGDHGLATGEELREEGVIGRPHFAYSWRVETTRAGRMPPRGRTARSEGGGVLGNFVSHIFYNMDGCLARSANRHVRLSSVQPGGTRR